MKTKNTFTLLALIMLINILHAQVHFDWAMHFGGNQYEYVNDIAVDPDGPVYATGKFNSAPADFDPTGAVFNLSADSYGDIYVAKYASNGLLQWAFKAGNPSYIDYGTAIEMAPNGSICVAGVFTGNADFDPGTGSFYLGSNGSEDCFIANYDTQGNFLSAISFGSTGTDLITDMAIDNAGNRYVVGRFAGIIDFDPDPVGEYLVQATYIDAFMAKYNANNEIVWAYNFGGDITDEGLGLSVEPVSGDVCITGYFSNTADFDPGIGFASLVSNGYDDIFVARYDTDANLQYAFGFGSANASEKGTDVQFDHDSNVILTGIFNGIIDFDPGTGVHQLAPVSQHVDMFLVKFNPAGNLIFAGSMGGSGTEAAERIAVDYENNIFLTGAINSYSCDMDPGPDTAYLPTPMNNDLFIAKYTPMGEYYWAGSFTGSLMSEGLALEANDDGIILGGSFAGQSNFDFTTGSAPMQAPGFGDESFLCHYIVDCELDMEVMEVERTLYCNFENGTFQWVDCDDNFEPITGETNSWFTPSASGNYAVVVTQHACVDTSACMEFLYTGIASNRAEKLNIYPNPVLENCTIETSNNAAIKFIEILDMSGRLILQVKGNGLANQTIELSNLNKGIYMARIHSNGSVITHKILKQ